jgi:hypothetical protein
MTYDLRTEELMWWVFQLLFGSLAVLFTFPFWPAPASLNASPCSLRLPLCSTRSRRLPSCLWRSCFTSPKPLMTKAKIPILWSLKPDNRETKGQISMFERRMCRHRHRLQLLLYDKLGSHGLVCPGLNLKQDFIPSTKTKLR